MKKTTFIQTALIASTLLLSAAQDNVTDYKSNFYQAVNKQWLAAHTIPADKSSVSTFTDINDVFVKKAQALMVTLLKKEKLSTDEQKIVDYYSSYIDMKGRNAKGIAPLKPMLDRIDNVKDYEGLSKLMVEMYTEGLTVPYNFSASIYVDDATKYVIDVAQNGIGLQTKFYEDNSTAAATQRKNYRVYFV